MLKKEFFNKNIIPFLIGLFCLGITFFLLTLGVMKNFENFFVDARFNWKRHLKSDALVSRRAVRQGMAIAQGDKVNSPIMIFGIDEASLNELGRWPWPRSIHKEFLDFFYNPPRFEDRPYLVFYDIFFDKYSSLILKKENVASIKSFIEKYVNLGKIGALAPERNIRRNKLANLSPTELVGDIKELLKKTIDDPVFFNKLKSINEYIVVNSANQAENTGHIFTDFLASTQVLGRFDPEIVAKRLKYMQKYIINVENPEDFEHALHRDMKAPVTEVIKNVAGSGAAMIFLDSDGVVRHMPLLYRFYDGRRYTENGIRKKVIKKPVFIATVDLMIAMQYYKVTAERVKVVFGRHVILKGAKVPQIKKSFRTIGTFKIPEGFKIEGYTVKDIVIPIDKSGQMVINFQGQHKSFDNASYFEGVNMLRQNNSENRVNYKNRVLLVGFYTSAGVGEGRDYFTTPYKILYGIEIHANALHTIFTGDFITTVDPGTNFIIYVILLILFAIILPRIKIWKGFILFFLTIVVIFFGGMIVFERLRLIIHMISLMSFVILQFLGQTIYRLLTEEKEKRKIRGMFAQYVNPEVVTSLMADPDKLQLGGEDRELTVMFSDIRGFTTISEQLQPQQLVLLLNEYLTKMTDILFDYRGTLDKYIGDAVMAFWGAPIEIKSHAILACDAALKMMDEVHALNERLRTDPEFVVFKDKGLSIDIGIGLNSGTMTVGNMGSLVRKNYTIMGDNVNLGSRLEGVNKVYGTNIIVNESTYEIVKDHFITRELDLIRVKGKKLPVRIYELMGRKDGVTSDKIKAMV